MLKLVRLEGNRFDLALDDPTANDADAAAATVIYAELYTDSEAPEGRVSARYDRRGWWYDPAAGSALWHVRRQPLDDDARRETLTNLARRLTTRDPAFSNVVVQEVIPSDPAGNVSSVLVEVTGSHNGRKFIVRALL